MIKVLHVYRTYFPDPPGGLQEAIRQIALSTQAFGIEPRIFTLSPSPTPTRVEYDDLQVIRARSWAAPASCDIGGINAFRVFAKATQWADVIHYHHPWPFADILDLMAHPARTKILTYHSDIIRQQFLGSLYRPLMQRMLNKMDYVVSTSTSYLNSSPVLSNCVPRDKQRVIPLAIDEQTYPTTPDYSVMKRLGLARENPFFLFIGALRYYKGLHSLIAAATRIDTPIVIAGTGPNAQSYKAMAKELGATNIIFAGSISNSEKVALLQACRALVLPSHLRAEAFGMVLVEASMFGKPMISCEIGTGTTYVNIGQETGLTVTPESPDALAKAMQTLLEDSALAERYGKSARLRYETLFSGHAAGRAYAELYQDAIQSHTTEVQIDLPQRPRQR